jgi:hypothetical protein
MIDFIKKFSTYFAASLTFLIGLKAAFGFGVSIPLLTLIAFAVGIASASIAWAEVFPRTTANSPKLQDHSDEGPLSLSIKRAMDRVSYAPLDDESIAFEANRIVKRGLDKGCINYKDYRLWRRKNPAVFTAITDRESRLLGFFDVFPLTEESARALMDGKINERQLKIDAILPQEENRLARYIYIASIMVNPKQKTFSPIVAKEVLLLKFAEFIKASFQPNEERILFAYAHTVSGERLLRNAGFTNTVLRKESKQRDPLYELTPSGYSDLIKNLEALQVLKH